ncbi:MULTISPECIES: NfeD family protein [Aquitalea]|jgi:membrane protein implicated in regulation of membrane protease activity|uniref:NfeD family protein n=1 Tax=Aquitalea TaxID=407217 RepID=UPI0013584FDA|nr:MULTISPECIES: NfeD family protein [Aquitalea]
MWLIAALLALVTEFMTGTFYLLMLALALAVGGVASLLGADEATSWWLASLSGIAGVTGVARWRSRRAAGNGDTARNDNDPDIGQPVRIIALQDEGMARVHYRGTEWQARLAGHGPWHVGETAHITGRDGNVLLLSSTHTETR